MSESSKKSRTKDERLRLIIMNDATFEEKLSLSFVKNKILFWSISALILLFILFFLFISFTPLKRLTPGYASIENNTYVIKMNSYVDELEKHINQQEKYNNSLRKLLIGEGDSLLLSNEASNVPENINEEDSKDFDEIYSLESGNNASSRTRRTALASYYYIPPLDGKVNNKVDLKKGHYGVDIVGIKNAPIKSIMEGIVVMADYTTETGYTIAIQHPNDMLSIYKHNDRLLKDVGNFVNNGEAIAIIGNTGELTDGPHLHFELWYKSTPLNPEDYIVFK